MVSLIEKRIHLQDKNTMSALIITDYYEIIKELLTAILLIDGFKSLSHKELIDYLKQRYSSRFSESEIIFLDDLRKIRNRVVYEGFSMDSSFLERNTKTIKLIINKLKSIIIQRIK